MRAVIQRVSNANVKVDNEITGEIKQGLLVLLGVEQGDEAQDLKYVFDKTIGLRIFEDENEKMNLSVQDVGGQLLVVSQFTLLGDVRRGKRPSFTSAASPEIANGFYEQFIAMGKSAGITTETGVFQADMAISLVNDGPVTILLDSRRKF
jgi:D-tyrosyl-tRNA(Tyr) deacylase